ncbi:MAG: 23S rRNA (guanosine(2251)-2'-O)-methyltransferase RlmB [Nitrospirae bacterium CG_4_10_14_3_um_filter_44_29]|nr:23S rRNA (guanosine(2251)-2'-O)-methyltransferase RlmB [Nitrospirota bacterium]OIO31686.1 MAG: 23S rRNA (guanosine(2251)-2'-O)-methyltransferase RlmB [Nitrospirae bacterium CG1_02_44_142]PIP69406.1 MAG: 23S rRNA (guanosine(2251)-2'-O)-methyltransferase RlmB [Nitrospirae bacterium CG22_combo_CG10-13_8_21_14_all_44_11]PIV42503.1 MAG: 23S rRNA (guanosine(2251)-2'-O)-methyltransferase RlmB [Nitrospirae bacterium CG02_land_8_20_14_3_00_44_33]PIW89592.1 MAG: 23S rRNA (guanosine(2251)-2'-O)-methylt
MWIYGLNPVLEALRAGRNIKEVYISSGRHEKILLIKKETESRGIALRIVDAAFFNERFPKGHQGVAAKVSEKGYMDIYELLNIPEKRNETPLFLILDCIEDPGNVGAIVRSADAAGVHGVVIQEHRSAGLGPAVSKASAGAVEYVPVSRVSNIKHAISEMKERGITIIGAESGSGNMPWDVDFSVPTGLVIGSEYRGLRKTVAEKCDFVVSIPMRGRVNSLNVSAASAVLMFEVLRQRMRKN